MASDDDVVTGPEASRSAPAPFLTKTYQLVDDVSTNDIVSWGLNSCTFVVWKPMEFARDLLPNYFKHNNFSSFVRQLNTYGFRKVVPDRWEFGNENFQKGAKQLLCDIHRRKTTPASNSAVHSIVKEEQQLLTSSPSASEDEEQIFNAATFSPPMSPTASSERQQGSGVTSDSVIEENERLRHENMMLLMEVGRMRNLYMDLMMEFQRQGSRMAVPVDPAGRATWAPSGASMWHCHNYLSTSMSLPILADTLGTSSGLLPASQAKKVSGLPFGPITPNAISPPGTPLVGEEPALLKKTAKEDNQSADHSTQSAREKLLEAAVADMKQKAVGYHHSVSAGSFGAFRPVVPQGGSPFPEPRVFDSKLGFAPCGASAGSLKSSNLIAGAGGLQAETPKLFGVALGGGKCPNDSVKGEQAADDATGIVLKRPRKLPVSEVPSSTADAKPEVKRFRTLPSGNSRDARIADCSWLKVTA